MTKRGLFITVEGMDGSGKTTQLGFISDYLKSEGREVIVTREPGGTRISERIRSLILDPELSEMGSGAEMLLYAAARAQLVTEVIRPSLARGAVVLCDRYIDSTYAYQGFGRGIDMETLLKVNNIAIDGIMPDVTFFYDLDPETALKRRIAATAFDRIENEEMEFHRRVYAGYLHLAARYPFRVRRIDAGRPVDIIWEDAKVILDKML
jgi:dTMP kinase